MKEQFGTIWRDWHDYLVKWTRDSAPKLLEILILAFILVRLLGLLTRKLVALSEKHSAGGTVRTQQVRTITGVVHSVGVFLIIFLTGMFVLKLGKRLDALREKYADIQQSSLDFLRELLELARDTVAAEKTVNEIPREEQGKAALTELFEALKTDDTPIIVDNIVSRIDEVVRAVRFEGWRSTIRGDQEVRQALRKTLYVQFKIRDNDVFEKALEYVREYY